MNSAPSLVRRARRARRIVTRSLALAAAGAAVASSPALATTGPYSVSYSQPGDLTNHTVYRPNKLPAGQMPVLIWGEGGCIANGLIYQGFLSEIASHGILVIASGGPLQIGVTNVAMMERSVDWAKAQNVKAGGAYKGHLAADRVVVAGHSCGGLEAYQLAAKRPEVAAVGIMDSGQLTQDQKQLDAIKAPTLYVLGGSGDIAYSNGVRDYGKLNPALPAFLASTPTGHFGTYWNKDGGQFAEILTAWTQYWISGDTAAGQYFTGASCILCTRAGWKTQSRNL